MIKVNGKDFAWEDGLTVEKLLQKKRFSYSRIILTVNGEIVPKEDYGKKLIKDGDKVQAIHLMAGG